MKSLNLEYLIIPIAAICLGVAAQLMIKLPEEVSVVPITGQSLAVLLIMELMNWKKGSISLLLYFLMGGIGFPFFADFGSGWEVLIGVSMGYFGGFLLSVLVLGYWSERSKSTGAVILRLILASLLILLCGWLGLLRYLSPADAFSKGVLPFLAGALVKIFLAFIIIALARRFKGFIKTVKHY